ncbi:hypothetical protein P7C70_g1065, partial [Phenoliferia sp. Uapishka_3]
MAPSRGFTPQGIFMATDTPPSLAEYRCKLKASEKAESSACTFPEEDEFEEGGWRGWLNVIGAFTQIREMTFCNLKIRSKALNIINTPRNRFGVYQSFYQEHQFSSMEPTAIAWLGSVGVWIEFSSALYTGPLFDRGYVRSSLITGSALFVFTLFMISLCKAFWQTFLAQAIGLGIAMGLTYVPAISVLSHYFRKKRAFVMGIAMTDQSEIGLRQGVAFVVSGIAALIGPPISGALLSAGNGSFIYAIAFSGGSMALGAGLFAYSRTLTSVKRGKRAV